MKKLFLFFSLILVSCSISASNFYPYASVALGYKLDEAEYSYDVKVDGWHEDTYKADFGGNDTAIFEAGIETNYNISFGLKHDSQWSTGKPFNDKDEYHKTEIFIRYKIGGRP